MEVANEFPCSAVFVYVAFALPNKLTLPQSMSSHTFTFPIVFPIMSEETERVTVWSLPASWG